MNEWEKAFDAFSARKTREAADAAILPLATVVERPAPGMLAIGNDWSRRLFGGPFYLSPAGGELPSTNVVFVQSREGNTVAKDPSVFGGGAADKHLIYEGLSRVAADGVLSGAETVRGGKMVLSVWHPELVSLRASLGKPRHPVQLVATLRGLALDQGVMFNVPDLPVVLITVAQCMAGMSDALQERPWIETVLIDPVGGLREAFRALRQIGLERVSSIGGRTIAAALIDAGLVDDLYLTKTPISAGQPNTPLHPRRLDGEVIVRKSGTARDAGVTFEHLVRVMPV